jgi:hypothetical protein
MTYRPDSGSSFVVIGSVVCSISIPGGRAHRGGPNNGPGREWAHGKVVCRSRLGGLLSYYHREAA